MYTGLSVSQAVELLSKNGINDYNVIKLVNDKQQFCDKEVVIWVRKQENFNNSGKTHAQIITTLMRSRVNN